MSKVRIYHKSEAVPQTVSITESGLVHKIKNVLRLRAGDEFYLFNGKGSEYLFRVTAFSRFGVDASQIRFVRFQPAAAFNITLAFAMVKENKVDFILQKSTELGVDRFMPFTCERSLKAMATAKRIGRWNKIIIEACQQSGRLWLPSLMEVVDFSSLLTSVFECKLVASLQGASSLGEFKTGIKDILVAVGPEGDFTPAEYRRLFENAFRCLRLSDNILRTETAAILAVGLLVQRFRQPH